MTARIVHHTIRGLISVELRHMSLTGSADDLLEFAAVLRNAVRDAERDRPAEQPKAPIESLEV